MTATNKETHNISILYYIIIRLCGGDERVLGLNQGKKITMHHFKKI